MTEMQIYDCEQGSPEWFRVRLGLPTMSEAGTIMANGKDGGPSKTRESYKRKLAAEIITGEPGESFTSPVLDRGKAMEQEGREYYELFCDEPLERVGFIRRGNTGVSPDSLVGANGGLEIKTQRADLLIETLEKGTDPGWFPPEHKPQCQGFLWIAGREWIDLSVYWPRMPRFVRRAYRDETYIKKLAAEVDRFNEELAALVEKIRRMEPDFMIASPAEPTTEQQVAALLADTNARGVPRFLARGKEPSDTIMGG